MKKAALILFFMANIASLTAQKRTLEELIDPNNEGWKYTQQYIAKTNNKVEILPRDPQKADSAIVISQLATNTVIGGVLYNCGGILVDNGWLRILGSGCKNFNRSLQQWNKGKGNVNNGDPNFILIADDAIGGLFALNTGGIDELYLDKVFYFGPNSLIWQPLGINYAQFIRFAMSDDLNQFYKDFKWSGWEKEVAALGPDQVVSSYPLLWTRAGKELKCNRKIMPIQKLWDTYAVKHKQLTSKIERSYSFNERK